MSSSAAALADLDSRSFERKLGSSPLVVWPVGALEAHGPHPPLGSDLLQAEGMARAVADRFGGVVAPGLPYGLCVGARRFPGTVSLRPETLTGIVAEVLGGLAEQGVRRVLVLSGHGEAGHLAALRAGAERAVERVPELRVLVVSEYEFVYELRGRSAPATDGHAGLLETSLVLHHAPDRVGPHRAAGRRGGSRLRAGPPSASEWPESVDGDPSAASAALGAQVHAHVLERLSELVARELGSPA